MKKFIALTLALVALLCCLVACKKDPVTDPDATTTAGDPAATTKSTVATEQTEPADEDGWSKFY